MVDFETVKSELGTRLAYLENRVEDVEENLRKEHSSNFSEQAHEREDDEVLERLEMEAVEEIAAIKAALIRIDEGTYGACTTCGEDIAEERLKVLPFANKCVDCAQ